MNNIQFMFTSFMHKNHCFNLELSHSVTAISNIAHIILWIRTHEINRRPPPFWDKTIETSIFVPHMYNKALMRFRTPFWSYSHSIFHLTISVVMVDKDLSKQDSNRSVFLYFFSKIEKQNFRKIVLKIFTRCLWITTNVGYLPPTSLLTW